MQERLATVIEKLRAALENGPEFEVRWRSSSARPRAASSGRAATPRGRTPRNARFAGTLPALLDALDRYASAIAALLAPPTD